MLTHHTNFRSIVLANTAEAFGSIIDSIDNVSTKRSALLQEHYLSNRAFFYESDNKVVVTPFAINSTIFKRNSRLLGYKNVWNIALNSDNISLSKELLQNKAVLGKVIDIIQRNPGIEISAYSMTHELAQLLGHLKSLGLDFKIKGMPKNDWVTQYLDSKVGFRFEIEQLKEKHSIIKIPNGTVCSTPRVALRIAESYLKRRQQFVVKAEYGQSGWGTLMIDVDFLSDQKRTKNFIMKHCHNDEIWKQGQIILEKMIVSNGIFKSPSSELYVDDDGCRVIYLCEQEIDKEGKFLGVAIGEKCLDEYLSHRLCRISKAIGYRYWNLGYRGFFDIDFVLNDKRVPYVVETNMRRTGGTHVFDLAQQMLGLGSEKDYYLMSNDSYFYSETQIPVSHLLKLTKEILFPIGALKKGIVLTNYSTSTPVLGYIAIGNSKEEVTELSTKFHKLLSKLTNQKEHIGNKKQIPTRGPGEADLPFGG